MPTCRDLSKGLVFIMFLKFGCYPPLPTCFQYLWRSVLLKFTWGNFDGPPEVLLINVCNVVHLIAMQGQDPE